jgi:hypothetical protein
VSNQVLELMFQAHRSIDEHLRRAGGPHTEAMADIAARFESATHGMLKLEIAYRAERGFLTPTTDDPAVLEKYLERASLLKKHFHELLFLAAETNSVDAQLRSYGTIAGAMCASMFGFILNKTGVIGHSASLGLIVAAIVGAVVYTLQDRIKDLGKTYLPTKLGKRYAQRITRLLVPSRDTQREGKLVGTVAESLVAKLHSRPDALNPELGAFRSVNVLRYTSRGLAEEVPELRTRGIVSLKQIFRYDLSWLFARLDDARKSVPVVGATGLRAAEAPRWYRIPVRVKLSLGNTKYERAGTAVMNKGGLVRLDIDANGEAQSAAQPALARR